MGTSRWILNVLSAVIICFAGSKRLGVLLMDKMGRSAAYQEWSQKDPAYQRVNVSGEPAVASRGQGKKKVCVRPNPPNLNSLISPCDFYSNLDVTFFDSCPHLSLPDLWPSRQAAAAADRGSTAPSAQGRASPLPGDPEKVRCLPGLLCIVFHSSGSFETRLCNGGVGDPPHHNTMGM